MRLGAIAKGCYQLAKGKILSQVDRFQFIVHVILFWIYFDIESALNIHVLMVQYLFPQRQYALLVDKYVYRYYEFNMHDTWLNEGPRWF